MSLFPWWYRWLGIDLLIASKMSEIASLKNLLEYNHHLVDEKDKEIIRLNNLMLTRAGFIAPLSSQTEINQHEPINKRQSWPARQRELQQQDAKRAADLTAERWAKKAEDLVQQELEEKLNASQVS